MERDCGSNVSEVCDWGQGNVDGTEVVREISGALGRNHDDHVYLAACHMVVTRSGGVGPHDHVDAEWVCEVLEEVKRNMGISPDCGDTEGTVGTPVGEGNGSNDGDHHIGVPGNNVDHVATSGHTQGEGGSAWGGGGD